MCVESVRKRAARRGPLYGFAMGNRHPPWQSLPDATAGSEAGERVWRRREFATGLTSAVIVAALTVVAQMVIDDRREALADRREDVRFVRQLAADGTAAAGSLRGMDLSESNLSGLDLAGADLTDANLSGADLTGTHLNGATLTEATLTGARLERTVLFGARMDGADLADVQLIEPVLSPEGAGLVGLETEQDSPGLTSRLDMSQVNFSSATISQARFDGANLNGADFSNAIIETISDTGFGGTSFEGAEMRQAKFYGVDLSRTRLPGMSTEDRAGRIMMSNVCADNRTVWPDAYPYFLFGPVKGCEPFEDSEARLGPRGDNRSQAVLPPSARKPLP